MELANFYSNHFKSFAQSHKNYCRTEWFLAKPTESSWCQACLCLMPGRECTFLLIPFTVRLSNSYYRQRVTFWLLCFYLVYSLDCLVKIQQSWRFNTWNPFRQIEVTYVLAENWDKKRLSWLLCIDLEGRRVLFHVLVSTHVFLMLFRFLLFLRNHNRKPNERQNCPNCKLTIRR